MILTHPYQFTRARNDVRKMSAFNAGRMGQPILPLASALNQYKGTSSPTHGPYLSLQFVTPG